MAKEELYGKTAFDLHPAELAEKYFHDDQQVITTGEVLHAIEENQVDGQRKSFEVWKFPTHNAEGRIVGVQIVFWDVTERMDLEDQLRAMNAKTSGSDSED